jgi:hypothetical protein
MLRQIGRYVDEGGCHVMVPAWRVSRILSVGAVVNRTVDGDVLPDTTRSQMFWLPRVS